MIPKSQDGYSRMSKELQVGALIAGATAALIFLAIKLHGHVDLIDPGVDHIVLEAQMERQAEIDRAFQDQATWCRYESDFEREHREWNEQKDREVEQDRQERNEAYDRGIERDR